MNLVASILRTDVTAIQSLVCSQVTGRNIPAVCRHIGGDLPGNFSLVEILSTSFSQSRNCLPEGRLPYYVASIMGGAILFNKYLLKPRVVFELFQSLFVTRC